MIKINKELLEKSAKELGYLKEISETDEFLISLYEYADNLIRDNKQHRFPINPPPEKHPYVNLHPVNPNYHKYVIGTFPPISYQSDLINGAQFNNGSKISQPQLPFYHGNRQKLWQYLLSDLEYNALDADRLIRRRQLIDYLNSKEINYLDVISYCQRSEYNADDSSLYNLILNDHLLKIADDNSEKELLMVFNTSSLFTASGIKFFKNGRINAGTYVFDMFVSLLIDSGIEVKIQFKDKPPIKISIENKKNLAAYSNIIRFDLYINKKRIKVVAGPSPADGDGTLHENLICKRFVSKLQNNQELTPGETKRRFKKYVYQTALLGNCDDLYHLNYD
jgi:hypothetical protein